MEPRRENLGTRARVAWSVLDAHLDWCRGTLGPEAGTRALASLPTATSDAIEDGREGWVPFWAFVAADRAIAALAEGPAERIYHELGRHSAVLNWTTPYREFEGEEPHRFFERIALWHDVFQDFGAGRYAKVGLHAGQFTIEGADEFSPVFCASAVGYFEGALQMMGAPGPVIGEESLCHCAGDPACVFALQW